MIARTWFLLSCLWAVLILGIAKWDGEGISGGVWFVALAPLFVPACLRAAIRFIAEPRPRPPYRRLP